MKYKSKQITVIIANYNSEWNKIKSTILSVVLQEDVDIEIIISDDSSSIFFESEIRKLLESYSFSNYTIIRNEINVGTVKNIYNALCLASGEYTYVISPGDLFFERKTLSRLMIFAQENKVDICFGDYVPYSSNTQSEISIMDMKAIYPKWPDIYEKNISVLSMFEAFMYGNYIVGACFFRKTKVFLKYLEIIKDVSKYVEDNTTTAFLLADGIRVYHYKTFIIWYEHGSGISTRINSQWNEKICSDFKNSFILLHSMHTEIRLIKKIIEYNDIQGSLKKILFIFRNLNDFGIRKIKYIIKGMVSKNKGKVKTCDSNKLSFPEYFFHS